MMLQLLILTAARSGEIRGMRWEEIDLANAVLTIPAKRMKAKVAHRVPLSSSALEILEQLRKQTDGRDLVFASRNGTPLSDMVLTKLLRQHRVQSDAPGRLATAHGFRSSFRDWASESGHLRYGAHQTLIARAGIGHALDAEMRRQSRIKPLLPSVTADKTARVLAQSPSSSHPK